MRLSVQEVLPHYEKYAVGATSGGYGRIPTRGRDRVNQWWRGRDRVNQWWKQRNIREPQRRAVPEARQPRLSRRFFQLVAEKI